MAEDREAGSSVKAITKEIVRYLNSHPSAADSLEGIADWWLPGECGDADKVTLRIALQELGRCGVVEAIELGDGTRLYRLARRT